jgi:hypothetical protein
LTKAMKSQPLLLLAPKFLPKQVLLLKVMKSNQGDME